MSDKLYQIGVDPGNSETAIVVVEILTNKILSSGKYSNKDALLKLENIKFEYGGGTPKSELACEMIASYGMPVGKSVFDTCLMIGRIIQMWSGDVRLITRNMVKNHICHSSRATDANIRQALMDRYGSTKELAVGTKKNPGPMFGLGNDERAALAVAFTAIETNLRYETSEFENKKKK